MNKTLGQAAQPNLAPILLAICALEGVGALVGSLLAASEPGSAVLFGLSLFRLGILLGIVMVMVGFAWLAWSASTQSARWQRIVSAASTVTRTPAGVFSIFCAIFTFFLALLAVLVLCLSPAASELVLLRTVFSRLGGLLAWAALVLLQSGGLLFLDGSTREKMVRFASPPLRAGVHLALASGIYTVFLKIFLTATWDTRLHGFEGYIFLPALVLLGWGIGQKLLAGKREEAAFGQWMMLLFIGAAVYTVYWHTAQWARFEFTRDSATWHLVARSFLEGKLYLENPASTHDLTFYNGHWYVPVPPLPALVVLPFVALFGADKINMVQFSIFWGAANAVMGYLMLSSASRLKMIPTSTAGNLWLTALLAFGTTHWWLSVYGIYWYLSQLLTLFFASLAVVLALKKVSPWLIGLSLGVAILSRPNVFTLWPLLAGIALYLEQRAGGIRWKRMFLWAVKTAVPVLLCVSGLLFYNYLRFDNFFDFGYVTVNSSTWIMEAVRTYGMFNAHFLPINFQLMFLKLPFLGMVEGKLYYSPGFEGTSILSMTPAILYLFRRLRFTWWTIGAWVSILFTAGLLLFYHNTGSWQLGYRYLMDFILPVLLLIGIGIGPRTSRFFILLVLLSVLINAAGVAWWFTYM